MTSTTDYVTQAETEYREMAEHFEALAGRLRALTRPGNRREDLTAESEAIATIPKMTRLMRVMLDSFDEYNEQGEFIDNVTLPFLGIQCAFAHLDLVYDCLPEY